MDFKIQSPQDWESYIDEWISNFSDRQVVLLDGPMGVGKTFLTQKISEKLDAPAQTHSPTFAISNKYQGKDRDIYHLDLYRLETEDELESTGFWDIFSGARALIVIEWSEKIDWRWIPPDYCILKIQIDFEGDSGSEARKVKMENLR